jgi:poly [ADP-ribose] polymerase 7/11/12/13
MGKNALCHETQLVELYKLAYLRFETARHTWGPSLVSSMPDLQIELDLFHGTKDTPPNEIYLGEYGFDMTFSGEHGMWGRGTYFAQNASYSCNFYAYLSPDEKRQIFLAQVLTGHVYNCEPDRTLRRPPKKNENNGGRRYNSVSGVTRGTKVYIAYENRIAYPTYLITFS